MTSTPAESSSLRPRAGRHRAGQRPTGASVRNRGSRPCHLHGEGGVQDRLPAAGENEFAGVCQRIGGPPETQRDDGERGAGGRPGFAARLGEKQKRIRDYGLLTPTAVEKGKIEQSTTSVSKKATSTAPSSTAT